MNFMSKYPHLGPSMLILCSLMLLWSVGYHIVWERLTIQLSGTVVESRDFPNTDAPAYVTYYTIQGEDGQKFNYIATDRISSLERSMPPPTKINKEKWELGYLKNGGLVSFPVLPCVLAIAVSVCGIAWAIWILLPERKHYREY